MRAIVILLMFTLFSCSVVAQNIFYVRTDGNDANTGKSNTSVGAKATLASAIGVASSGDVIQIGPGNYSGTGFNNINLGTKHLKIIGSGNSSNASLSTVITGSGGFFLTLAKGASAADRMEVWNMRLSNYIFYFFNVDSNSFFYNLSVNGDSTSQQTVFTFKDGASDVTVEKCQISNIWNWTTKYDVGSEGSTSFMIYDDIDVYNINVNQCLFDKNYIVFYFAQGVAGTSKVNANNISIKNSAFTNCGYKAIYAERLDNFIVDNCSFVNTGSSITAHPAAIDINLKWETYSGNITIKNSYFSGCGIPNSGTNVNGAAILFKSRDFGGYISDPASFTGNLYLHGCTFKNNNAGFRIGESNNGSGTTSGNNSSYGSGTIEVRNSVFQNNTAGSYQTYNHFAIRNVSTRNINVLNCYFGGGAATTNTAFSGPIDVSTPNASGSTTVTGTLTTGEVIRLSSSDVYQADYADLSSAITAASDGDKITIPPGTIGGTTTVNKNLTFYCPGAGNLYSSHLLNFQNLTVSGTKTLTMGSDGKVSTALSLATGNVISLGQYCSFDLGGTLSGSGTFTGSIVSSSPKSELWLTGTGSITLPAVTNGLAVLNINRAATDTVYLSANLSLTNVNFSSAYFNLNGFKLTVNGATLLNAVNFIGTATGSELEVAGSNRTFQFSGGTIANFNVNRNQGTQLTGDLIVTNTLTLSNGSLFLGSFNCTMESSATINGTPSASKMIIATGTGQLRKKFTAAGSFTFPVGDDVSTFEFSPVTLNFTSGTFGSGALAGVNLSNVKHPSNASGTHFLSRYWTVSQTNITAFSCNTSFTYVDADINGTESNLFGGKHSSSVWTNLGAVNTTSNLVTGTVTSFSDFTAGETTAMPVSWLNVSAEKDGKQDVVVKWSTANELENDYFEIQYAQNGLEFETAGFQKGSGTTLSQTSYQFVHPNVLVNTTGNLFYRIKQVDYNGDFSYSNIVSVKAESSAEVVVYPVPLTSATTVELPAAAEVISVSLTNAFGAVTVIPQDNYKQYLKTINLSNLNSCAPGMYWLEIRTVSGVFYAKVLRQH